MFASVFVTAAVHFGDFTDFGRARGHSSMFRAFGGVSADGGGRSSAPSAVSADLPDRASYSIPNRHRRDLEPYSPMAGRMLKERATDEAGLQLGRQPERVVMLKCSSCGKLNDEDAKFCQECGEPL